MYPDFELCGDEDLSLYLSIARSRDVQCALFRASRVASVFASS